MSFKSIARKIILPAALLAASYTPAYAAQNKTHVPQPRPAAAAQAAPKKTPEAANETRVPNKGAAHPGDPCASKGMIRTPGGCVETTHWHTYPTHKVGAFHITLHKKDGRNIETILQTPMPSRNAIPNIALNKDGKIEGYTLEQGDYLWIHGDPSPDVRQFLPETGIVRYKENGKTKTRTVRRNDKDVIGMVYNDWKITFDEAQQKLANENKGAFTVILNKQSKDKCASGAAQFYVAIAPGTAPAAPAPTPAAAPAPAPAAPASKPEEPKSEPPKPYSQLEFTVGRYASDINAVDQAGLRFDSVNTNGTKYTASFWRFSDKLRLHISAVANVGDDAGRPESVSFNRTNAIHERAYVVPITFDYSLLRRKISPTLSFDSQFGTWKQGNFGNAAIGVGRDRSDIMFAPGIGVRAGHNAGSHFGIAGHYFVQQIIEKQQDDANAFLGGRQPYTSTSRWEAGPMVRAYFRAILLENAKYRAYVDGGARASWKNKTLSHSAGALTEMKNGSFVNGYLGGGIQRGSLGFTARYDVDKVDHEHRQLLVPGLIRVNQAGRHWDVGMYWTFGRK